VCFKKVGRASTPALLSQAVSFEVLREVYHLPLYNSPLVDKKTIGVPKNLFYNVPMAKTSYINIPAGLEKLYKNNLQSGNRYIFPRIVRKHKFISREKKSLLYYRQMVTLCAEYWKELSQGDRDLWIEAAGYSNQRGYNLFVQDTVYRIKYGIPGLATPDNLHQFKVGRIVIEAPSDAIRLAQFHPYSYYIQKKVAGTKSQYAPVEVTEPFTLPLEISINYKSYLEAAGANPSATFYAEIYHNYQGATRTTTLALPIDLASDWTNVSDTISSVIGEPIGYALFIDIQDCTGELQFDDVKAVHSSVNWVRDYKCNAIDVSFTKQFYQVPRNWVPQIISDDAWFDSVYPT